LTMTTILMALAFGLVLPSLCLRIEKKTLWSSPGRGLSDFVRHPGWEGHGSGGAGGASAGGV